MKRESGGALTRTSEEEHIDDVDVREVDSSWRDSEGGCGCDHQCGDEGSQPACVNAHKQENSMDAGEFDP